MKVSIHWTYIHPNGECITLESDVLPLKEALKFAEDFEKTGRTKALVFRDSLNRSWSKKELQQFVAEIESEVHDIVVYFDGSYDLNSKKAGAGIVIYYNKDQKRYRVRKNSLFEELQSNNEAEYAAFWFSLQALENIGVHHMEVTFKGDSHVVLNQLSGDWPVYEKEFNRWCDRIEKKMNEQGIRAVYEPIKRKWNKEADRLAFQALKGIEISSCTEQLNE